MKTKLKTKIFRIVLIILFAIFLTMFISNKYGYYEYKKREQVTLTQKQIKQFEEDIKNGKDVNLENYLENTNKNYQTKFSQLGLNISNSIASVVEGSVNKVFGYISKFVVEN